MTGFITRLIQSAAISESVDVSVLQQQKSQLDALTLQLRELSPAIVALDKQKVLLAEYKLHLLAWRTAVVSQYRQAWKRLILRLVIVLLIIGLLIGIGEVARRLALNRIQDLNRRRIEGLVYRLVTLLASAVAAIFDLASDARSFATYFGLLTAGVAVALQNMILASLGYLLLIGKHGIRHGDRVQVSGVAGDVIYMGLLQFQLREFDADRHVVTGRLATFSNSLVFSTVILKKAINLDQHAAPDSTPT
jgi:small-conductance mechanosensitive channel